MSSAVRSRRSARDDVHRRARDDVQRRAAPGAYLISAAPGIMGAPSQMSSGQFKTYGMTFSVSVLGSGVTGRIAPDSEPDKTGHNTPILRS